MSVEITLTENTDYYFAGEKVFITEEGLEKWLGLIASNWLGEDNEDEDVLYLITYAGTNKGWYALGSDLAEIFGNTLTIPQNTLIIELTQEQYQAYLEYESHSTC